MGEQIWGTPKRDPSGGLPQGTPSQNPSGGALLVDLPWDIVFMTRSYVCPAGDHLGYLPVTPSGLPF